MYTNINDKFLKFLNKNNVIEHDYKFNFNKINDIKQLKILANFLLETILEHNIPIQECDCIYSTAYKGVNFLIPLSMILIDTFATKNIKIGYVTKNGKDFVGYDIKGDEKVLLLDDVFNTGNTLNALLNFIQNKGIKQPIASVVAVFNGFDILKKFYEKDSGAKLCAIYFNKN